MLIAFVLAGSAGVASAATSSSSGSWSAYAEQLLACVSGNPYACMATGGSGTVSPDTTTNPTIVNK
ncbi:MAG TPA: hypothetical protein VFH52_11620 [Rhodanobacteraceae bacterium]|nr:hypothetical protein [Rhodanobacteraceae bacterium]